MTQPELTGVILRLVDHMRQESEAGKIHTLVAKIGEDMTGTDDGRVGVILLVIGPKDEMIEEMTQRTIGEMMFENDGLVSSFDIRAM